jgi:hypothetical protein
MKLTHPESDLEFCGSLRGAVVRVGVRHGSLQDVRMVADLPEDGDPLESMTLSSEDVRHVTAAQVLAVHLPLYGRELAEEDLCTANQSPQGASVVC